MKNQTAFFVSILLVLLGFFAFLSYNDKSKSKKINIEYNADPVYMPDREATPEFLDETTITSFWGNADPPKKIEKSQIEKEISKYGVSSWNIVFRDKYYNSLTMSQFDRLIIAWKNYIREKGIQYIYDLYDCDNYANAFKAFVELSNFNLKKNIAVANFSVENVKTFAFVQGRPKTYHMLNMVLVNEELYVVEPQNGIDIKLSKYPNNNNIIEVEF